MTRLEKRIAFDMTLFYFTLIIFWVTYQEEYSIMDQAWKIIVTGYLLGSSASIYSVIVTNKYLKDFCILISLLRFSIMFVYILEAIFNFEPNTKGTHLPFIAISTLISFFLSKTKLILHIRKMHEWLNLG